MGNIDKNQHFEAQFEEVRSIIDLRKTRAYRAVNNLIPEFVGFLPPQIQLPIYDTKRYITKATTGIL